MQREIKFRAWDKATKQIMIVQFLTLDFEQCQIWDGNQDSEEGVFVRKFEEVELLQYTGLKDKNGKEIYEGDVCKDDTGHLMEIIFGKLPLHKSGDCVCTYPAFYAKDHGKLGEAPWYDCTEIGEWFEVIGNIYESPELLKD